MHSNTIAVVDKALRLAEHLMQAHKRKLVDPLILSVAVAVANRFRAQRRSMNGALDDIGVMLDADHRMPSALPQAAALAILTAFDGFTFPGFDDHLDAQTREAFDAGWGIAADQLSLNDTPPDRQFNDLVTEDIDATTRGAVIDAARSVFAGGLSLAALITAVDEIFTDAIDNRADTIATTEIASAFNAGASALAVAAKQQGVVVEKMWSAEPDACDICQGNADQGWIDDDEAFDSGDDAPPGHPWCRCSLELRTESGE